MIEADNNTEAFFALVRVGLWENEVQLSLSDEVDFQKVYQLAEYQSVIGLVLAGVERFKSQGSSFKMPQELLLQWIGSVQMLEQRNVAMNAFVAELISGLRKADINTLLVKGQGVAQCYERPLWRNCGDVDLYLSDENYEKAKKFLLPLSSSMEPEDSYEKHLALTIDSWMVELHGRLKAGLSRKVDKMLDRIHDETFHGGNVRSWNNTGETVFMLGINNDVVYVFTHIMQHYFHGGIGLRQVCDWCRLLWQYRSEIDLKFLEKRIRQMGLISEWKSFGAFAVESLGMPAEAMPFYELSSKWQKNANRIKESILRAGNFGHRDLEYVSKYPYVIRKLRSMMNLIREVFKHLGTFPLDSLRFSCYYTFVRLHALTRGE